MYLFVSICIYTELYRIMGGWICPKVLKIGYIFYYYLSNVYTQLSACFASITHAIFIFLLSDFFHWYVHNYFLYLSFFVIPPSRMCVYVWHLCDVCLHKMVMRINVCVFFLCSVRFSFLVKDSFRKKKHITNMPF